MEDSYLEEQMHLYGSADHLADAQGRHHQSTTALFPSETENTSASLYAALQAATANQLKSVWENHMYYCPIATPALNYTIRGESPPSFCPNLAITYNPLPSAMHNSSNSWLKEGAHAHYGKDLDLGEEGVCMWDGTSPCNPDSLDTSPSPPRWESLL